MSIAEIKSEIDRLSPEERLELKTYLSIREEMSDPEFIRELSRKIANKDSVQWISLEEVEKKFFPEGL